MDETKERPTLGIQITMPRTLHPGIAETIESMVNGETVDSPLGQRAQLEMLCHMTVDFACMYVEGMFRGVANQPGAAEKITNKLAEGGELRLRIDRVNAADAALEQIAKLKDPKAVMS